MRILFSKRQDWEPVLREALRPSPHIPVFADFADATLEACDVLVPLTIADLEFLDAARRRVSCNPLPIPSLASVRLCNDKLLFAETLLDHGFGDFIPAIGEQLAFPRVLKKRVDEAGAHSHVVAGVAEEQALLAGARDADYFRQRLVRGECEYTTHLLIAEGRVLYALHIETAFGDEVCIKGRDACSGSRAVPAPCNVGIFASMLACIGFEGLCCVNYKLEDGRPQVFEINPRCGWSLCAHFAELIPLLERRSLGNLRYFIGRALHELSDASRSDAAAFHPLSL